MQKYAVTVYQNMLRFFAKICLKICCYGWNMPKYAFMAKYAKICCLKKNSIFGAKMCFLGYTAVFGWIISTKGSSLHILEFKSETN